MHTCFRTVLISLLTFSSALVPARAAEKWETDYSAALEQAAKQNKMVLLDFTGSDWCGWCVKLQKETFSKPEFKKFAEDSLVLVELDFPRGKPQSDELKKQNEELAKKFGIEGFPTLVLLDPQGKEAARNVGFLTGGPEAFIQWVESARQQ
ncbi:MAG TPA: thioredoxin family protein [Terrimicrobiaceae bacterium]|nr:thioredoxin family protein [Terrimicrobiaceae bacterium]